MTNLMIKVMPWLPDMGGIDEHHARLEGKDPRNLSIVVRLKRARKEARYVEFDILKI